MTTVNSFTVKELEIRVLQLKRKSIKIYNIIVYHFLHFLAFLSFSSFAMSFHISLTFISHSTRYVLRWFRPPPRFPFSLIIHAPRWWSWATPFARNRGALHPEFLAQFHPRTLRANTKLLLSTVHHDRLRTPGVRRIHSQWRACKRGFCGKSQKLRVLVRFD